MTIECYQSDCPYHGNNVDPGSGPFCDEPECRRAEKEEEKNPVEVEYIKRLRLRPGDMIIVRVPNRIGERRMTEMANSVNHIFPGHKVLVLEEGADIEVIAIEEERKDEKDSG